ncbi:FadR family transcriptional regulator [Salicibibacter halophilus]|uniref:FadR family transcriptional regulator n=1 Tax=Salicibibacter halophilus TaxID=2502791 RepID=A0A514LIC0_9BACI|nr:FadR/GntR family transcriptional regulator [Salicibibacter halophilus]QDI91598.1 FadR family transcriptional regulator [Salicibibacter halophilus]
MEYKPIRTKKVYEEVAESLIDRIKKGTLTSGDKLDSVEQLAKSFEVGRPAIREALSGLRTMGIVEMRQGEGTYVRTFDASKFTLPVTTAFLMKQEDVKELYEMRKILEVGAAGLAAKHHQVEDLLPIQNALDKMKNTKGDDELAEIADLDFHLAIAKATHNQMLIYLMSSVSEMMAETIRETRRLLLYSEGRSEVLFDEHTLIFNAIKRRRPEQAEQYMYDHLAVVEELLFKHIE